MIYIGNNEYPIYLGSNEIPAIYCGEELIYPVNLGTLTGITIENITWVTDVPYTGGTADKDNCSYKVVGHYDSGKSRSVTNKATVTGSLVVPAGTGDTREAVGTLELTATYSGFTASGSVIAYQEEPYQYFRITNRTSNDGTITIQTAGSVHSIVLRYRTNGGTWTNDTTYSATFSISLPANGYVELDGRNNPYWSQDNYRYWALNVNVEFDLSGDLYSLVSARTVTHSYEFFRFNQAGARTNIINASGLTMNALTLKDRCYQEFFSMCSNLLSVPELPARTLATGCYENLFYNANKITYVKCLAETPTSSYLTNWMYGAKPSSGTFVKYPGVTWPYGEYGIPNGWTVLEATE